MRPRSLATALLVPLALTSACAGKNKRAGSAAPGSATLEVRSNYIRPVNVYVVRDNGSRVRLASNVGNRTETVRLDASFLNGGAGLQIIAVALGNRGVASTGAIVVRPGDVVEFTIAPNLASSTVFVR